MDTTLSQQLQLLVRDNTGTKLEMVIEQIISSSLYNVRDLLISDNVQALNNPKMSNRHYNTLNLLATLNYTDYKANQELFLTLSGQGLEKLKIVTILDTCKDKKSIDFVSLMKLLDIPTIFELDYLIFQAISLGMLQAKVDEKNKILKVLSIKGRDCMPDLQYVESKLDKWIQHCEQTDKYIDSQIEKLRSETVSFNERIDRLNDNLVAVSLPRDDLKEIEKATDKI